MSYSYAEERHKVFTEDGQIAFLEARDKAAELLKIAGAFRLGELMSRCSKFGDSFLFLALVDRLEELGEIRKIDQGRVAGQDEIYVKAHR